MPPWLSGLLGAAIGVAAGVGLVRRRPPRATPESEQSKRLADAGRRLAEVAHELNNPLAAILAFSQDLVRADPPPEQREALRVIQQQARRARKLVRGLLEEVRAAPAEGPRIHPAELVSRIVPIFERDAERHGLQFSATADPDLPPLEADAGSLEQVLTNLLQNAFQATPRGGQVTLNIRARGRLLEFVIEDNGPGIPPEFLPHIFDPFFTSKQAGEGTGLGLSVSQDIVRRHRGTLTAENLPPWEGGGARFIVALPFIDRRKADRDATLEELAEPGAAGRKILLVEDDEAVRLAMRRYLEKAGWVVGEATEGQDGLAQALKGEWDVIVCDVQTPGLSGIELYDRLEQERPGEGRRVVLISGDTTTPEVAEFCRRTGAAVLAKPFELAHFGEAVERAAAPPTEAA
jgi:nitrogen-specific signal transduction histidine kinase/ActR/RegA family two-component response regulator